MIHADAKQSECRLNRTQWELRRVTQEKISARNVLISKESKACFVFGCSHGFVPDVDEYSTALKTPLSGQELIYGQTLLVSRIDSRPGRFVLEKKRKYF